MFNLERVQLDSDVEDVEVKVVDIKTLDKNCDKILNNNLHHSIVSRRISSSL